MKKRPIASITLAQLLLSITFLQPAHAAASSGVYHASTTNAASISVDVKKVLGKVSPYLFGHNQLGYQAGTYKSAIEPYLSTGYGIWDPDMGKPNTAMLDLARAIRMSVCRWPGGCGSHNFQWKKTIGPVAERPRQRFGLPEFLAYCEAVGAKPIITVAEYWGDAADGADLVEYLNAPDDGKHPWAARRSRDGHPEPWGVIWFEYGNESCHGNHGGGDFPGLSMQFSPAEYGSRYIQYRKAMKAADGNIELGVAWCSGGWNEMMLTSIGSEFDFISAHTYVPRYNRNDGQPPANELFPLALAGPERIAFDLRAWRDTVAGITGRTNVRFAVTEYNGSFAQSRPVPYRHSLGNALVVAEHLRVYQQEPDIFMAVHWQFANEYWGMIKSLGNEMVLRPTYWVFRLYGEHSGDKRLGATVSVDRYETAGGYHVLPARGDGQRFELFPENLLPPQAWELAVVDGAKQKARWFDQKEENGILEVDFHTEKGENYFHASKRMPAKPSTGYRVSAEVRWLGLSNGGGAALQVGDGRGYTVTKSAKFSEGSKERDWKTISADYFTLPDTKELIIQARSLSTGTGDGRLEMRNVRAQRFSSDESAAIPNLGVAASIKNDGTVCLMIVNKSMSNAYATSIEGVPAKGATAWCLSGPSVDAVNELVTDLVTVNPLAASWSDGKARVVLPPFSLTAVELR